MSNKVFFDTNVLIYMQSGMDPSKSNRCRELFDKSSAQDVIVLSTQILQEFYVAMTRKLHHDPLRIKSILSLFLDFEIVSIDPATILDAIDISILHRLSFWDSLLISCAAMSRCNVLYSEDLQHGQVIRSVRIVNPFAV